MDRKSRRARRNHIETCCGWSGGYEARGGGPGQCSAQPARGVTNDGVILTRAGLRPCRCRCSRRLLAGRARAGRANAGAGTDHVGWGQFSTSTWAAYGQGDRTDPIQSMLATQRYAAANNRALTSALGRTPDDAELYLAHQQGPGDAVKLLTHPGMRAGDLVGDAAIKGNGGDPNAPASAFTQMWTNKFNHTHGAPPVPTFIA